MLSCVSVAVNVFSRCLPIGSLTKDQEWCGDDTIRLDPEEFEVFVTAMYSVWTVF